MLSKVVTTHVRISQKGMEMKLKVDLPWLVCRRVALSTGETRRHETPHTSPDSYQRDDKWRGGTDCSQVDRWTHCRHVISSLSVLTVSWTIIAESLLTVLSRGVEQ